MRMVYNNFTSQWQTINGLCHVQRGGRSQSYQGERYGGNQAGQSRVLCGGLDLLFQGELPAQFRTRGAPDR